ncbi:MAG: ribosome small subunit-dependent GTPase A [Bacteroidales bacterium]|jgi:ribosome biogenesis GTPase|nr:ribosome small subunit-dependent GTPase A [Bacteroidales bacterium]HHT52194.1 ribosome small subunit-dependent GTPase A [Bacteroidales bacterium]
MKKGLVLKSTGTWYDVLTEDQKVIPCRLRGKFRIEGIKNTNPLVVGDHVLFELMEDQTGIITEIEKRKNYIDRKSTKLSKISHLIAANIDQAFLVVTLQDPRTSLGFIDRFLVAAEGFRIPTTLVFNKMDIYEEEMLEMVDYLSDLYSSVGYSILHTSIFTKEGIDPLREKMFGKVSLFSGHSGVGKSALINTLYPGLDLKVGELSQYHRKGRHTTTFAQMFQLEAQTFIIDTPGIKEFGLIEYSKDEIRDYFPEIRAYNNQCRFADCTHVHEPDCEVIKAVEEGKIPPSRYLNYVAILEDDDLKIADWELV